MSGVGLRRGGGPGRQASGSGGSRAGSQPHRSQESSASSSHRPDSSRGRRRHPRGGRGGGRRGRGGDEGGRHGGSRDAALDASPPLRLPLELQAPGQPLPQEDEQDADLCGLCCQPMNTFVAANCSHSAEICGSCLIRLHITKKRALIRHQQRYPDQPKQREPPSCPLCKTAWNVIVVTDKRALLDPLKRQCIEDPDAVQKDGSLEFRNRKLTYDREVQTYYTEPKLKEYFSTLRSLRCLKCIHQGGKSAGDKQRRFQNIQSLNAHLRKEHKLRYCTACFETLDLFLHERELYTDGQFRHHCRNGSPRTTISPQDIPLFSADELWVHLTSRHARCVLCHNEGRRDEYFRNHAVLLRHLHHSHYVCQNSNCLAILEASVDQDEVVGGAVFLSLFSLQVHEADVHSVQLNGRNRDRRVAFSRDQQPKKDPSDHGVPRRDLMIFRGFDYYEQLSEGLAAESPSRRGDFRNRRESSEEHKQQQQQQQQRQQQSGPRPSSRAVPRQGSEEEEKVSGMSAIRARALAANVERADEAGLFRKQAEQAAEEEAAVKAAADAMRDLRMNDEMEFPSLAPAEDPAQQQQTSGKSYSRASLHSGGRGREEAFPAIAGQAAAREPVGVRAYRARPITQPSGPEAFPSLPQSSGPALPSSSAAPTWEAHRAKLQSKGRVLADRQRHKLSREKQVRARENVLKQSRREQLQSDGFVDYQEESRHVRDPEFGLSSHGFEGSSKIQSISALPSSDPARSSQKPLSKKKQKAQEVPSDFLFPSLQSGPSAAAVQESVWPRSNRPSSSAQKSQAPSGRRGPQEPGPAAAASKKGGSGKGVLLAAPMGRQEVQDTGAAIQGLAPDAPKRFIRILRMLRNLLLGTAAVVEFRLGDWEAEEVHHLTHELNKHLLKEARRTTLQTALHFDHLMYFGVRSDHVESLEAHLGRLPVSEDPEKGPDFESGLAKLVHAATEGFVDEEIVVLHYWLAALLKFHLRGGDADGIRELRKKEARVARNERRNQERWDLQKASEPDDAARSSKSSKQKKKKKAKKDNVLLRFGGR